MGTWTELRGIINLLKDVMISSTASLSTTPLATRNVIVSLEVGF